MLQDNPTIAIAIVKHRTSGSLVMRRTEGMCYEACLSRFRTILGAHENIYARELK